MTGLLFLIFVASLIMWFRSLAKEKEEQRDVEITAAIEYGHLKISFHYESRNPIWPSVERAVRCWAAPLENPKPSRELYAALESELHQLPAMRLVIVTDMLPINATPPLATPKPSRAEQVKTALVSDADTVQEIGDTLNELKQTRSELWDNRKYPGDQRPIGHHLDEKADSLIRHVLHGSERRR
jgi:hypothetical protein